MTPILQDDGTLLVPVGACTAAEQVRPGDPDYAELLVGAVPEEALCGPSEEDAALVVRFERHYRERQPRSA